MISPLFGLLLLTPSAQSAAPDERPPSVWQNIDSTPGFPDWRRFLQRYIDRNGHHRTNHLCVVVRKDAPDSPGGYESKTALISWPEEGRIELLGATDEPKYFDTLFRMLLSQGPIILKRDLYDPRDGDNLNPFGVTQAWVDDLTGHCRDVGTSLILYKRPRR